MKKMKIQNIFAYKKDMEFKISKVLSVEWNSSRYGKLKPIIKIEPVNICDTIVKNVTGYDADYIVKKGIGKNAIIKVIKSGQIIPKIFEVLESVEPELPTIPYIWNDSHKEIYTKDLNSTIDIKTISLFYKTIGVKNIGIGIITKLNNIGLTLSKK